MHFVGQGSKRGSSIAKPKWKIISKEHPHDRVIAFLSNHIKRSPGMLTAVVSAGG
jgi:hypothetical protein